MKMICDHIDLCLSFASELVCDHEEYHNFEDISELRDPDCNRVCKCEFLYKRTDDFMVRCITLAEYRKRKLEKISKV